MGVEVDCIWGVSQRKRSASYWWTHVLFIREIITVISGRHMIALRDTLFECDWLSVYKTMKKRLLRRGIEKGRCQIYVNTACPPELIPLGISSQSFEKAPSSSWSRDKIP